MSMKEEQERPKMRTELIERSTLVKDDCRLRMTVGYLSILRLALTCKLVPSATVSSSTNVVETLRTPNCA